MKTITLEEIRERQESGLGPYEWISPAQVVGVDASAERERNKRAWSRLEWDDSDEADLDAADVVITNYLCSCLRQRLQCFERGAPLPKALEVTATDLVNAAVYLMVELGSHYPATMFESARYLITEKEAKPCISILREAYQNAREQHIAQNVRDFTLAQFEVGSLWEPPGGRFAAILDRDENEFLACLERSFKRPF